MASLILGTRPTCWLGKKGSRLLKPSAWRNFSTSLTKTNDWPRSKISVLLGPQEPLLATVKKQKLAWFGLVTHHDCLFKTILQGTLEGGLFCGQQKKCWMDIKDWPSLLMPKLFTTASCREDWKMISTELSLMSPWRPNWSREWAEMNWTRCTCSLHPRKKLTTKGLWQASG